MKTIYLDPEFICHIENADGYTAIETSIFDSKTDSYIEGMRYIPDGSTWTRDDGEVFTGEAGFPVAQYDSLLQSQQADIDNALSLLGFDDEKTPSEEAQELRKDIDTLLVSISDSAADSVPRLFLPWNGEGVNYTVGTRVRYRDTLYRCLQDNVSEESKTPDISTDLWIQI